MGYYSFSDLAIEEIEEICEFLAQTHLRFASQWFDEVREKCKLVSSFPSMSILPFLVCPRVTPGSTLIYEDL